MMRKLGVIICISLLSITTDAQQKNKFTFGGTISVDFGRFNDRIEITPTVYAKVLPKVYLGAGATLAYYKQESVGYLVDNQIFEVTEYDITSKTTYFGGNLFARFYPYENKRSLIQNIYLQTEFEYLKGNGKYKDISGKYKFNTDNKTVFTGIGYKHLLGEKTALTASLFFKLNNENDSPYRNPIIRIGFEF